MYKTVVTCAIVGSLALALPAAAATERASFRLSATVHTICQVSFGSDAQIADGRIEFGLVRQLCNSRNGFRVTMIHPAGLRNATFIIGGRRVPLSLGNETVIIEENHPTFITQPAKLDLGATHATPPTLSFRIEAKGVVY